jgi:Uma2 family endonuclease
MGTTLRKPRMTREEFLDWVEIQEGRWEFDGFEPVAMTGGTRNHERICQNIYFALRSRLRGGPCEVLGATAGIAVGEDAVRYPDALVTCTPGSGTARVMPGPVVVFEVISPTSGRVDRIAKLREYQRVGSIRRYVTLESTSAGLTVHARRDGDDPWTTVALTEGEALPLPEIDIEVPVAEFYEGVAFEETDQA